MATIVILSWFITGAIVTGLLARIDLFDMDGADIGMSIVTWPITLAIIFIYGLYKLADLISGGRLS